MLAGFQGESIQTGFNNSAEKKNDFSFPIVQDYSLNPDEITFQYCTEMIIKPSPGNQSSQDDLKKFWKKGETV